MPAKVGIDNTIREICVDPQPNGLRAVYLVETRSSEEEQEVENIFSALESQLEVRQLTKGKLVSFVVQAHESDAEIIDEIEDVLKKSYVFVVTQRSFDELICRIINELSRQTDSKVLPIPKCNICGKVEPFPSTVVNLSGEDGSVLVSRNYCACCTAEACAPNNKDFIKSLLAADKRNFGKIERAQLVRHRSRKQPLRYLVSLI